MWMYMRKEVKPIAINNLNLNKLILHYKEIAVQYIEKNINIEPNTH